jgi:hypothetical protein
MVRNATIVTPGVTTDRYNNASKNWTAATRTPVKAWISQRNRAEVLGNREAQLSDWIAYLPAGTEIDGGDRIEWESLTFEIDGPPNPAWSPRGPHHVEVQLRLVEG